jgi:hypothetical protein
VSMDAWRARLQASFDFLMEDDDEEDAFNMSLVLGLGFGMEGDLGLSRGSGGSRPGKIPNINRDRFVMHKRMIKECFCNTPVYSPAIFRRCHRMRWSLLLTIMDKVCSRDSYFLQKVDACGLLGLSTHQKITAALRMLCYGLAADATDEYYRTSKTTAMLSLKRFCIAIKAEFEGHHLKKPNRANIDEQFSINAARGFPGMFGSLDCMHYICKNCLVAWQGDFGNRAKKKSIILEATADEGLHIWHAYFGFPGCKNDVNVLDRSPLIHDMLTSPTRDMQFMVNGCMYDRYYLLTDGIYP